MKRRLIVLSSSLFMVILIVSGLSTFHAGAQGGGTTLEPGVPQTVTLNAGQAVTRTFSLTVGEAAQLTLTRQSDFTFTAVVIDPNQTATPLVPGADGNVVQSFDASAISGTYTLVIQAMTGSGDMVILFETNITPPTPLQMGLTQVTVADTSMRYILTPPAGTGQTTLLVQVVLPAGLPTPAVYGLPATTLAQDPGGEPVFSLETGRLPEMSVVLLADQSYLLTFERSDTPVDLLISWEVRRTETVPVPTSAFSNLPTTGPCYLAFISGVNVRPGPSTAYTPPIGVAGAGQTLPVIARNQAGDWYQVTFNGQLGWVSVLIGAVGRGGDCSTLPIVAPPPLPGTATVTAATTGTVTGTTTITPPGTITITATPSLTATMDPNITWTPTSTPSWTPSLTATGTPSETPTWTLTPEETPTQE